MIKDATALAELQNKYDALEKEYQDIRFREELYRVAIGLTEHSISIINIKEHTLKEVHYEIDWRATQGIMKDVPESIIQTGVVHEDSIDSYRKLFADIYAGLLKGDRTICVRGHGDDWIWLHVYYQTVTDQDGQPQRAICFSENITRKHEAEIMFNQFLQTVEDTSDYSWLVNLTKDIVLREDSHATTMVDGAVQSYTQLNENALSRIVKQENDTSKGIYERNSLLNKFNDGVREVSSEYLYLPPEQDTAIWMEGKIYMMLNTDNEVCAMVSVKNIDQIKRKKKQMEDRILQDSLCHVMKREAFNDVVKDYMQRNEKPIVLFMIDVDNFKFVNDHYGHAFGDEVLIAVASQIKKSFRKDDLVARYGGDEFTVLMTGEFEDSVMSSSAKSLLNGIAALSFDNGFCATISVGAARWDKKESLNALYRRADEALYSSKRKGKNCFTVG